MNNDFIGATLKTVEARIELEEDTFELLAARLQTLNVELDDFLAGLVRADVVRQNVATALRVEDLVELDEDVEPGLYQAQLRVMGIVD